MNENQNPVEKLIFTRKKHRDFIITAIILVFGINIITNGIANMFEMKSS